MDGCVPGLDLAAMRSRAQQLFEKMRSAYPVRDLHRRPTEELFPPTFALARGSSSTDASQEEAACVHS